MRKFGKRLLVFLFGLLLLALPALVVFQAMRESESMELRSRQTEAAGQNNLAISFLRNQESFQGLLDKHLSDAALRIPVGCSMGDGVRVTGDRMRQAALQVKAMLGEQQVKVEQMVLYQHSQTSNALASSSFLLDISTGQPEQDALIRRLAYEFCQVYVRGQANDVNAVLNRGITDLLGGHNNFGYLFDEFRNRTIPIKLDTGPMYLFWAPLFDPKAIALIKRDLREEKFSVYSQTVFPNHLWNKYLLGAVIMIIPRSQERAKQAEILLNLYSTQNTVLSLFPSAPQPPLFHASLSPGMRKKLQEGVSLGDAWVTGSATVEIGDTYTLVAATRLKPMDTTMLRRHRLLNLALGVSLIIGTSLLFCGVFLELTVGASISGQLWWSFTFAAILPIAVAYYSIQQLVDERLQLRLQQNRLTMLQEISSIENRFLFHRPILWHLMGKFSQNPHLLRHLRRSQRAHSLGESAPDPVPRFLKWGYDYFMTMPYDMSIRRFMVAGVNGFFRSSVARVGTNADTFPLLISLLADEALPEMNPDLRAGANRRPESSGFSKNELLKEFGFTHMHSMFGPSGYLNLLYGQNKPFSLNAGHGSWFMNSFLLPPGEKPEFVMTWMYLAKYSDRLALRRILVNPRGPFRFFAFEPDRLGHFVVPQDGESMPVLRGVARQVFFARDRISLSAEINDEPYQIEGSPMSQTKQFILVGISSEAGIRQESRQLRLALSLPLAGMLVLVFLLSWFASWDILVPLRELRRGMQQVDAGTYSCRLAVERSDELGEVCQAFNDMARGLEEAELMKKMVSSSARKAMESVEREALAQAGESLDVTVLFIGIPQFESFLQAADPRELTEKMSVHTSLICRQIDHWHGEIDKLIGDKTLAYFSHAELGEERAVENAVAAVRELMRAHQAAALPFPIAIGINSGTVIKGLLGSGAIRDYTIIGDPVNLAARAESVAEGLSEPRIVITANTLQFLGGTLEIQPLNITRVKGKQRQVMLSRVLSC